jgi:demethylmenaquinone methyltransferase/2-methoxy-6-polyprenyl-1,4-benzoquinol methylase
VLDLCCGTADMTAALLARRPQGASQPMTAIDFSHEMIERGRTKLTGKPVVFIEADALNMPLADASQDLVVSAFGFRNLADYAAGLREIRRVLKPGGSIGILDFSEPPGLLGSAYRLYFRHVLPRIGGLISGSGSSYAYLPASVERFPAPDVFCGMMQDAGFTAATWQPYLFGVAGLWSARAE